MKKKFFLDKHTLIPKHTKLSEKEKKDVLERYHVTLKELPKIRKNDAAIKNLNCKQGDVVKILRKSSTSGEDVFYRGVISE